MHQSLDDDVVEAADDRRGSKYSEKFTDLDVRRHDGHMISITFSIGFQTTRNRV